MGGKTKSRYDGLDVAAMTAFVKRSLIGHKLANVYDGIALSASLGDSSGKGTFLFKLANPSANSINAAAAAKAKAQLADGEVHPSSRTENDASDSSSAATTTPPVSLPELSNRSMLLIESGVRFHTTTFYTTADNNPSSTPPSPFAMKLRKHLRNLRLENIRQLGKLDRVVDFRFGSGDYSHHLILELYGLGNIILTNDKYVILALLRLHEYEEKGKDHDDSNRSSEQVKVRVGNVYPVTYATTIVSEQSPQAASNKEKNIYDDDDNDHVSPSTDYNQLISTKQSILEMNCEEAYQWAKVQLELFQQKIHQQASSVENESKKKKKKKKKDDKDGSTNLKMLLLKPNSGVFHYGPSLIEHCILCANLEPTTKFDLNTIQSVMPPSSWELLIQSLKEEGSRIVDNFNTGDCKGYVLYKQKEDKEQPDDNKKSKSKKSESSTLSEAIKKMPHSDKVFEEFQPHLLRQHQNRPRLIYDNFSMAVDEFYSLLEGQKRALRAEAAEQAAKDRLEKIKLDQSKRMEGLEIEMNRLKEHAELVELHADDVDKAIGVINSAINSGMDWNALGELVEVEKANMNPIALLIKTLTLEKDSIVLSLPDTMSWDPESDTSPSIVDVTVSLNESAYANARIMYDKYRASKEKATKTAEASEMALKAAESNAQKQIAQAQKNKNMTFSVMMQPQRKQLWFEKFHWFITSDNYIVIGGRDAQQNEMLVKRYLRPGDAYLHADVHGAPTCVLRAKRRRTSKGSTEVLPLSDQALREAGNFAICRSSAWGSRMVTSAWWVESHQVSKTAPTGEYLTVGSFMIRGRKNFLPPTSLEMGLGVLFRLGDDVSIARHANDRRDFALLALEQDDNDDDVQHEEDKEKQNQPKPSKKSKDISMPHKNKQDKHVQVVTDEASATKSKETNEISEESVLNESISNTKIEDPISSTDKQTEPQKKKKGLSAKDRKLIKKYGSLEEAEEALAKIRQQEGERLAKKERELSEKSQVGEEAKPIANKQTRGKRAKLKKMAKKYVDQDDEDRELALLALQGNGKESKKNKAGKRNVVSTQSTISQAKVAAETTALLVKDAQETAKRLSEEVRSTLAKCLGSNDAADEKCHIRWNKLDAEVIEQLLDLGAEEAQVAAVKRLLQLTETTRVDNFSASLAGIIRTVKKYGFEGIQLDQGEEVLGNEGRQRKTKAEKEAEKEAWREILAEDGIIEAGADTDGAVDDTAEISKLTGKPLPEDVILYAVPVCAPYGVLSQYKYRVKLTPGSSKRGKASKQCIEMFYRADDQNKKSSNGNSSNTCIELIKAVNDNDWVQAMCGDVKISAAGASKVIKKQKSGKKKK